MMFLSVEFFVVFIVALIAYNLWDSTRRRSKYPPGPLSLPVVGIIPFLDAASPFKTILKLSEKYGDIFSVRIGYQNIVYVNNFDLAKKIFNDPKFNGRPELWSFKYARLGKLAGIILAVGSLWQEHRRFTLRHLRDFGFGKTRLEDIIIEQVKEMIEEFEEKKQKPFNVSVSLNVAIVNIIWHMVAGTKLNRNDPNALKMVATVEENVQQTGGFLPDLIPWTRFLPKSLIGVTKIQKNVRNVFEVYKKEIEKHEVNFDPENMRDLIDVYLKQIKEDEKNNVRDSTFHSQQLMCVVADMFAAGSETTSTTLRFAFIYLLLNPDIQKQLQKDIHSVIGKDRTPSINDRSSLPRIEAFILEVQRCADILPLGLPHATTETTTLENYLIPKGTTVSVINRSIHRDERYWPQPEKFDPSRFLDEDGSVQYKKDGFLPFSIGKRQCLGENLAKMELFLFLTGLLQKFNFSLPQGALPPDPSECEGRLIVHPPDYKLIATPV